ncbi:NADH-quinone oxidoreductase subunit C [Alicyclobacillus sp.]|uniref:NADH-quinone oxidoreductase subunit C n=1 Tax=Alicyclobacillus sp. TaxID=61169 RepID=UPI0025B7F7B0|nr:NADH-quinone oxidoreductase subunit C [Alicyclobacillus sp.]MCL6517162.1 NADH-quinone oxidoreductase subunit C [Alicyclobacillus sp.]
MNEEGRKPEKGLDAPATASKPANDQGSAAESEAAKSSAEANPATDAKPAAEAKPTAQAKTAAEVKPAAEAKPAAGEPTGEPVGEPAKRVATGPDGAAAKPTAAAKPAAAAARPAGAAKPAGAAAKKAPPPPDPRAEAAKAKAEQVKAAIVARLGEAAVEEVGAAHFVPMLVIRKQDWPSAVDLLRTHPDWKTNYLEFMAGTDYKDKGYIEVVIYLQSTELGHFLCLKTRTDRDKAEIPSLCSVFPGVNWEEREIYDLLGVTFTGHPDLRRIMLWDDFKGHPLRKDYNEWDERNA